MTTNYHTPIPSGSPANSSVINSPLSELDTELAAQDGRIGTLEAGVIVPSGSPTEYYDGDGNWTVPAGTGAGVDGHVIQDEGVDLAQRAKINFVGAGVTVTNEAAGTQVEIPGPSGLVAASIDFTAADLLLGRATPGAGAGEEIPLTAAGRALIAGANAAAQITTLGLDTAHYQNHLINGGFPFWQRVVPATATAMTDDGYNAPDRWYSLVQGAGATINRNAGIGTSQYAAKLIAGGTTNRYGIAQIVEAENSIPMREKTVTAQVRLKPVNNAGSGTRDYRIAILEWTGTANAVTSELVADWASATYTTSGFFASTTKTLVGCATITATHNVETVLSVTGLVSASCNNLIVFVWAEDVPTHASDYVLIGEAGLYVSSNVQVWIPRLISEEFAMCYRYCRAWTSTGNIATYFMGFATSTTQADFIINFTDMFATPSLVASASDWKITDTVTNHDVTVLAIVGTSLNSPTALYVRITVATTLTQFRPYFFLADATENRRLYIEAEL